MSKRHRKIVSEVNKIDETGNRYTRLLVLSEVPRKRRNNAVCWRCLCDCGKYVIARGADLRYGATKSCGCLKAKKGYKRAYRPDGTFYFVKPENCPAPPPRRIARNEAKKNNEAAKKNLFFVLPNIILLNSYKLNCKMCALLSGWTGGAYFYNGD
jgi:hypothetical protein